MTSKIEFSGQISTLGDGLFAHSQGHRFLDFLEIVLELLRSSLLVVFGHKIHKFGVVSATEVSILAQKFKIIQILAIIKVIYDHFRVKKALS